MPRIGIAGPSYTPYSISEDTQRTVNLYPELIESGRGKSDYALIGCPGLQLLMRLINVAIVDGGAGYTANDILTVVGGTGTAATLKVTSVAGGVIDGISVQSSGVYTSDPSDPVSVTGGTGANATFTLNFATVVMAIFYETVNKRIFAVTRLENSTIRLFEITLAGVQTDRGQLSATVGTLQPASISSNGLELLIIIPEKKYGFIFTLATNALTDETASIGNGSPLWGQFLDQYFIALCDDGQFYISGLLDGLTWDALDTAKAESSPDITVMMIVDHGELRMFGSESMETWYNSGSADFPFAPIRGATIPQGLLYRYSTITLDNALYWVGRGLDGKAQVWSAEGYRPVKISNHAVDNSLQTKAVTGVLPVVWGYQEGGHSFYVLTFPDDNLTWVYDKVTGMWHERMYLNGSTEEAIRGRCHAFAGGEDGASAAQLVGDRANGKIYTMLLSYYDDGGDTIRRIRRSPHIANEDKRIVHDSLQVMLEQNLAANQRISLRWSNNGGKTWSQYKQINVGPATSTVGATAAEVVSGGTGPYAVDNILTVVGGVGTATTLRVTAVSAGLPTAVSIETAGAYTANPTNPVSVTGGGGSGATFNLDIPSFKPTRAIWRRLGSSRDRIYEVMMEDATKWVLLDAYLNTRPAE